MKHFDNIINNMIKAHKDPKTKYSTETMFASKNELSFAISRLMDVQSVFQEEPYDSKEITPTQWQIWLTHREKMSSQTANDIALCIIQNTPLSRTEEEISELESLFNKTLNNFTQNAELAKIFTDIIFGEAESKMPSMKDH